MGMFVISREENKHYMFVFTSRKGHPIISSTKFKNKSDCVFVIDAIRENIEDFTLTRKITASGKYFFRISKGGLVLAASKKYNTELRLGKVIDEILKNIPEAETLDFSDNDLIFSESEEEKML